MSATRQWTVRRSRGPDLLAAAMVAASGAAGMATTEGWWWWAGAVCIGLGALGLLLAAGRSREILHIGLGQRIRLESADGGLMAEGLLDGASVVTPWLMALRIRSDDGRRAADLVLDAGSAPANELRRLRVRLLTDEAIRA